MPVGRQLPARCWPSSSSRPDEPRHRARATNAQPSQSASADSGHMTDNKEPQQPSTPGLSRRSSSVRDRARRRVRTITGLTAAGGLVGSVVLTAAIIPSAASTATPTTSTTATTTTPSTATPTTSAAATTAATPTAAPSSLTATKAAATTTAAPTTAPTTAA